MTQPTDNAGTPDVSADTTPTESLQLADQQPLPSDAPAVAPAVSSGPSHTRTILEVIGGVVAAGLIVVAGAVGFAVGHVAGSDDDRVAFSQAGDRGTFGQGEQGQGELGRGEQGQGQGEQGQGLGRGQGQGEQGQGRGHGDSDDSPFPTRPEPGEQHEYPVQPDMPVQPETPAQP